jgi:TolB-like protein
VHLLDELRRRNVHRAAAAYLVGAWLLVQVAETIFPLFGYGDAPARITVIVLAGLFVPALVLAWVFELTPEGLRRDSELDAAVVPVAGARRGTDRLIMAGMALAIAYFLIDKFLPGTQLQSAPPPVVQSPDGNALRAIAVLPFANLSGDPEQEFLSDGLAEELLGQLSRSRAFRVAARSSSFRFRERGLDPQVVGQQLGVRYLVEGSLRRTGERLRISAALIDTESGFQVWSSDYERTLSDILAVQEDIAAQVAEALQVVLDDRAAGAPGVVTAEAHLEFLKVRRLMASRTTSDLDTAIVRLREIIAQAPGYAPAHAELANALLIRNNASPGEPAALAAAAPLVERALALDPGLAEAYAARARLSGDPAAIEADLRQSLQLNPSYASAYVMLAELLSGNDARFAEAMTTIDMARSLDPLSPRAHHIKAHLLARTGELAAAELAWKEAVRVEPRFVSGWVQLAQVHAARGAFADAVLAAEQTQVIDPRNNFGTDMLLRQYMSLRDAAAVRGLPASGTLISRVLLALFDGDEHEAAELMLDSRPEERAVITSWMISDLALRYALRTGDFERARVFVTQELAYDGTVPATLQSEDLPNQLNLAVLWHAAGEPRRELIEELVTRIRASPLNSDSWSLFRQHVAAQAVAAAVLGEHEKALELLEGPFDAVHHPWSWALLEHAAFARLADHPRMRALREGSIAHAAAERERLAALRRAAGKDMPTF